VLCYNRDLQDLMANVLRTWFRVLTLRFSESDLLAFDNKHLLCGLFCTWLVGIGRFWDNPRAALIQHLGIGSIIYVFILAGYLYVVILALKPERWSYRHLLTFIALTSPPAILYAIPVELWFPRETARDINVWFLGIVATWRVLMYSVYLRRQGRLTGFAQFTATLTPLALIVFALTVLNLEQAVFNIMGGLRDNGTAQDTAYRVLVGLSIASFYLSPVLLAFYVAAMVARRSGKESQAANTPDLQRMQRDCETRAPDAEPGPPDVMP
jgi:hypothetical protein